MRNLEKELAGEMLRDADSREQLLAKREQQQVEAHDDVREVLFIQAGLDPGACALEELVAFA